ncbi:guanylate kinase (plasmid) [Clostridium botulinum B2 433]|nr:AAA family ATPase [Clostridium botulinum]KEI83970.1 guanylate kinase [Clostridium botulinum B2 433]
MKDNNTDIIICLVGESGSGKSTIAELLEKEGYNYIESYTTRKPRYKGERGHIFLDSINDRNDIDILDNGYYPKENVIAYTCYKDEHYYATKEQYKNKGTSIYIVEVKGVNELRSEIDDAEILVLYLKADEQVRKGRMIKRYIDVNGNTSNNYLIAEQKAQERIVHDKENFQIIPCDYVIDANMLISEVLKSIKTIIE